MSRFRLTHLAGMAVLAIVVASGTAKATMADPPSGRVGMSDQGSPTANGLTNGDINTATTFMIDDMNTTNSRSGIFATFPRNTAFPTFMFATSGGISFSNTLFGSFASTSITEGTNSPGFRGFDAVGSWKPGTFFSSLSGQTIPAVFAITFVQDPAHTGEIADAASFTISSSTRSIVPEPSSFVLVLTGLVAGVGVYGLRRRRRQLITT